LLENRYLLSRLIKEARKKIKLTQVQTAKLAGLDNRTYQRVENAENSVKLQSIIDISKVLGTNFLQKYTASLTADDNQNLDSIDNSTPINWISENKELPLVIKPNEIEGMKKYFYSRPDIETNTIGYWEWNLTKEEIFWSKEMYDIYGTTPELLKNQIHKDDIEKIESEMEQLIKYGVPYDNTHQVNKNKTKITVRGQSRKFTSNSGDLVIFGIAELIKDNNETVT
jgi:transcriptional regulator with XRE-family HTH domain